jgi:hypothetical protein
MPIAIASSCLMLLVGCKGENRYETELEAIWACKRWEKAARNVKRQKVRDINYTRYEKGKVIIDTYYVDQFGEEYPMPMLTFFETPDGKWVSREVSPYLFRMEPRLCIPQEESRQILGVMNEDVVARFRF